MGAVLEGMIREDGGVVEMWGWWGVRVGNLGGKEGWGDKAGGREARKGRMRNMRKSGGLGSWKERNGMRWRGKERRRWGGGGVTETVGVEGWLNGEGKRRPPLLETMA